MQGKLIRREYLRRGYLAAVGVRLRGETVPALKGICNGTGTWQTIKVLSQ